MPRKSRQIRCWRCGTTRRVIEVWRSFARDDNVVCCTE